MELLIPCPEAWRCATTLRLTVSTPYICDHLVAHKPRARPSSSLLALGEELDLSDAASATHRARNNDHHAMSVEEAAQDSTCAWTPLQ